MLRLSPRDTSGVHKSSASRASPHGILSTTCRMTQGLAWHSCSLSCSPLQVRNNDVSGFCNSRGRFHPHTKSQRLFCARVETEGTNSFHGRRARTTDRVEIRERLIGLMWNCRPELQKLPLYRPCSPEDPRTAMERGEMLSDLLRTLPEITSTDSSLTLMDICVLWEARFREHVLHDIFLDTMLERFDRQEQSNERSTAPGDVSRSIART